MDYRNSAFIPSIERIMKSPYFDGTNQTMQAAESSEMLKNLMEDNCYDYVLVLAKYFDKNSKIFKEDHPLIALLTSGYASEKWLMLYFDMLEKCKMSVAQDVLKNAFDSMDNVVIKEETSEQREKCKCILKYYLSKNVN